VAEGGESGEVIPEEVFEQMQEVYAPSGIILWWNIPNSNLGGVSPCFAWAHGMRALVEEEVERVMADG
jgi:hypothetical protein